MTLWKILLLCFFGIVIDQAASFRLIDFKNSAKFWKRLVNATVDQEANITEHWITQPLDNFDDAETRTWQMRYFQDLSYWQAGGPIVFILGGESYLYKEYVLFPLYDHFAAMVGGVKIATEHRYYGYSIPIQEWNVQNLQYLNSQQALADVKNLITYLKSQDQYKHSKVVIFGGSYAGNLAAWMRLQYPEAVDAALASSAPIWAEMDFSGYLPAIGDVIHRFNPACYQKILDKFTRFDTLLTTTKGIKKLKRENKICSYTNMTNPNNIGLFILHKLRPYVHFVQYGTPQIIQSCFSDPEIKNYDKYEYWNGDCNDYDFDEIEFFDNYQHDDIAWIYQTCNEFGFYHTTTALKSLFTARITLNMYIEMCSRLFGPQFDRQRIENSIKRTNEMYSRITDVEKVFYLHGDMDPWRLLGITTDLSEQAPARVLVNQSHGASLFDAGLEVPDHNFIGVATVFNKLKEWIHEEDFLYDLMNRILRIINYLF